MIVKAAVKIFDKQHNKEVIIPCHRHCDAFYILHELGYMKVYDYEEIEQGFLNEKEEFLDRVAAWKEAYKCRQIKMIDPSCHELFSEDLW